MTCRAVRDLSLIHILGTVFCTLYRRDFRDFGFSFVLIVLNFLFYFTQANYLLTRFLRFM